ncbi:N-acetylmuramoyl-L-alanine amidase [Bradyrhizobium neotropicale]|uniref:N-acetylmuramoyl-L-alanine amidase n=1 Tax=Bradyrhizobium neotropicale TaxID=1497615 RepID=UPI001AD6488F|nr:N-acetylmuramoyl-L-alanine amidase [Bradyrhizobium neotropicale]MBO4228381.1 hypothetical protein [Bradyrhizobium neotropicale]
MAYNSIIISSGHGQYVRGACGIIDEVNEARVLVERLATDLRFRGVDVKTFHDDVSYTQNENLNRIVDFHNGHIRQLDISVHFNAYEQVPHGMGVEVLYVTQGTLAGQVSAAIAAAGGLINRGAKKRTDLFFLNSTEAPAILLEVCFVDSEADCFAYRDYFDDISAAIADTLSGMSGEDIPDVPLPPCETTMTGKVSWFGGPGDMGVAPDEGLAFIYNVEQAPHLFLPYQPEDTTGLARRLNPFVHYIALRWNYDEMTKDEILKHVALVRALKTGVDLTAFPADWGPHGDTDRLADISPGLMHDLGIETDDEVEVIFPYRGN